MMDKPTYNLSTFIVVLGGGESGVGAGYLAAQERIQGFCERRFYDKSSFQRRLAKPWHPL